MSEVMVLKNLLTLFSAATFNHELLRQLLAVEQFMLWISWMMKGGCCGFVTGIAVGLGIPFENDVRHVGDRVLITAVYDSRRCCSGRIFGVLVVT